jgi:hypothetical protein
MKGTLLFTYIPASANRRATATPALPAPTTVWSYSAMFLLMRQNMELTLFHSLLHERDLVVHLHSRIGQPPSHSNASAAGANNNVVIFSFQLHT